MAKKTVSEKVEKWHAVPIKGSFMVFAIVGFLVSAFLLTNAAWRLAFLTVFAVMFVAALISLAKAPINA
ncbi:MAG TPA: hypothetical protein VJI98_01780 [Candidatus Nanoarchaeia archaeon]|nr:hypothetical protein [Candidatus Nanoarchaeia archaeon]